MPTSHSDKDIDQLLRRHAEALGNPSLSDEQRNAMITTLLKANREANRHGSSHGHASQVIGDVVSWFRQRWYVPVLAAASVLLVFIGLQRWSASSSEQPVIADASHDQQGPSVAASTSDTLAERNGSPSPAPKRSQVRIVAIQAVFGMRDSDGAVTGDSLARSVVFDALRSRLAPLGIRCSERDGRLETTLDVRSTVDDARSTLVFIFDAVTGEVVARPDVFTIVSDVVSDTGLTRAVQAAAADSYTALRRSE